MSHKLGHSNLTVNGYGCFLCSIATLYQNSPIELLGVPGGFTDAGTLVSGELAKHCGGIAMPKTTEAPVGWCIAMTDHYASQGFPTHYFCVNMQTHEQIDPLKFPGAIEPLTFSIKEFRQFTNTMLETNKPVDTISSVTTVETNPVKKLSERALERKNKRLQEQQNKMSDTV